MPDLPDWQDPAMTKREGWPDFQSALKIIHCPQNEDDLKKSKLPNNGWLMMNCWQISWLWPLYAAICAGLPDVQYMGTENQKSST